MNHTLAFFMGGIGMPELIIIGIIAVLLFGKRLPEVARSMGKGMVEFKKGIRGIEDDIDQSEYSTSTTKYEEPDDHVEATTPKFEPPTTEPKQEQAKNA